MRRASVVAVAGLLLLLVAAGCGGSSGPSSPAAETVGEPTTSTSAAPAEPLVGEWQRVNKCAELVRVLEEAGFEEFTLEAIAGAELVPGVVNDPDLIADPAHPCKGAVPRKHSHFFTPDGLFGSLDQNRNQVDDGSYEIVDDRTFAIGDTTFHYRVHGDTIMFDPVIPSDCSTKQCRGTVMWSITVAFPGTKWKRVG
jgi:hypothetical protein